MPHFVELDTDRSQPHTPLWYPQVSGLLKKSTSVLVLLLVFLCAKENVSPVEQCNNKPQHAGGDGRRAGGNSKGKRRGNGEMVKKD